MISRNPTHWLPLFSLCWILTACASLPDVSDLRATLDPKSMPTVVNANGPVAPTGSTRALMAKRWTRARDLKTVAALEQAATGFPLVVGNKVTLLFDGPQTMTEMYKAISEAKNNINLETYIFDQDEMGLKFAGMLIEKQKAGVTVNVMYDSVGTIDVPQAFFDHMRQAGIRLVAFNPVNPARLHGDDWKINNRDHRKILIVDGKIAFTGGTNISADYVKSSLFRSRSKPTEKSQVGWRDTHVKVEGPAVAQFQYQYIQAWTGQDAADLPDVDYFPPLKPMGDKAVRVIASRPGGGFEIFKAYNLAIQQAKKSIHITSAYFVPDPQTVDALIAAAQRGVDVKVVLPGVSDSGLVFYAGHALYQQLLDGGVRIYQLKLAVLHAKTAVIDGNWSTVGSTNMDMRSFMHNSELNVVVLGDEFGASMESAFAEDMRDSVEITAQAWRQRPLKDRIREWAARFMDYWL
ncbi:MAG TPA: cardiolipin synthase [Janthinobacterium sp.]|nr:cardiolipin synthase [Janthinobacterium sp.]